MPPRLEMRRLRVSVQRHVGNHLRRSQAACAIPVLCSDGRKGIVTATRDYSGMSGGGHFTLRHLIRVNSAFHPRRHISRQIFGNLGA
jgi:hypothetical protein